MEQRLLEHKYDGVGIGDKRKKARKEACVKRKKARKEACVFEASHSSTLIKENRLPTMVAHFVRLIWGLRSQAEEKLRAEESNFDLREVCKVKRRSK